VHELVIIETCLFPFCVVGCVDKQILRNCQTGMVYLEISHPVLFHELSIRRF